MAEDIDTLALEVARRFTQDTEPQRRASLQVAISEAIKRFHAPSLDAEATQIYNASGIDLTACQLHEALLMAGDPEFDVDFDDRGRVRIFYNENGHSGPGVYCECVDVEDEGCILLDGTSPAIRPSPVEAAVERDADLTDAVIDRMLSAFHGDHTNFHHVQWTRDQRRSMRAAIDAQNKDGGK